MFEKSTGLWLVIVIVKLSRTVCSTTPLTFDSLFEFRKKADVRFFYRLNFEASSGLYP